MTRVTLSVDDPTLVVPLKIGSAATRVRYGGAPAALWDRIGAAEWTLVDLPYRTSADQGGHADGVRHTGDFLTPALRAGEAYAVRAEQPGHHVGDEIAVSVIAHADQPAQTVILTECREVVHGAVLELYLTGNRPHRLVAQAGTQAPVPDSPSAPRSVPDAQVTVLDPEPALQHVLRLACDWRAGRSVHWLVRAVDNIGEWHELTGVVAFAEISVPPDAIVVDRPAGVPHPTGGPG